MLLDLGNEFGHAAHVGAKDFGDGDGAVFAQVVFKEGDEHAGRGDHGVVEGVGQVFLSALAADADLKAAGLGVAEVGAAADFEVFFLAGGPGFDITGFDLEVGQVAGAALEGADGDVQAAEELDGVGPHLVVPVHGFLGLADDDHLLLFKLVDPVDAALLDAVGTLFLAEAGGVAGQGLGKFLLGDDLVDEFADHGVLGGSDQVEVLALDLVHHGVHLGKAHDAGHDAAADHEGRHAVGEALVDHEVSGVGEDGGMESGNVAHEVVETVAGDVACGVEVDAVEALHDICVVGNLKIGNDGLAEFLDLDVAAVVGSQRNGGIDDLRDQHHILADDLVSFSLDLVKLVQAAVVSDLCLDGLGLFLLALLHQAADLLGDLLFLGADLIRLLLGCAALGIIFDDLVHERELGILEFLLDVLSDGVGIFS